MKKIINTVKITTSVLAILYFLWGTYLFLVMQLLSLVIMSLLSAYSHYRQNKERDTTFWSSIIIAIFVVSVVVIKSFF